MQQIFMVVAAAFVRLMFSSWLEVDVPDEFDIAAVLVAISEADRLQIFTAIRSRPSAPSTAQSSQLLPDLPQKASEKSPGDR